MPSPASSPSSRTKTAKSSNPSPLPSANEFKPEAENENFLVGEMIQARSKLLRLQRLESAAHEQILTEPGSAGDPESRILVALAKSGNVLDKLDRYAAAARRCYYKALRELQTARKAKLQNEAKQFEMAMRAATYVPMPSCGAGSQPAADSQSDSVGESVLALRAALRRDDPAGHPSVTGRSPNEPNPGYPSDNGTMVTRANSSGITSALAGLAAVSR